MKTKRIRQNRRIAFPDLGDAAGETMIRRIAANFGRTIAEVVQIPSFASGRWGTEIEAGGVPEQSLAQKCPAIYVSAHLGNWNLIPISRACVPGALFAASGRDWLVLRGACRATRWGVLISLAPDKP